MIKNLEKANASTDFNGWVKKFKFIKDLPGFLFIKDLSLNYIAASHNFVKLVGLRSCEEIINKEDYDFPCRAAEYADRFRAEDKKVMHTSKKMQTLEIYQFATGWKTTLVSKSPLKADDGTIIGDFCQLIDVTESSMFRWSRGLDHSDRNIINTSYVPTTYILNSEHCPIPELTVRQQECIFLMIRGKTIKEVAYILDISPRTVESYIENIKYKLGCFSKGQIIEKAITNGFLYYIPQRFLQMMN